MTNIETIAQFLSDTPMCFLATSSQGQPKVRPFQFQFEIDGKLWFCTSKNKEVFKQLKQSPQVQIAAVKADMTTLRLSGEIVPEDNLAVKTRILNTQPLIQSLYGTPDNPDFATFYLNHGNFIIFDFSGNPPQTGQF
ncbi:MAG: pyridoxamine 5'-phosphate oxidase family protein [Candidatus Adiutrix sp.]